MPPKRRPPTRQQQKAAAAAAVVEQDDAGGTGGEGVVEAGSQEDTLSEEQLLQDVEQLLAESQDGDDQYEGDGDDVEVLFEDTDDDGDSVGEDFALIQQHFVTVDSEEGDVSRGEGEVSRGENTGNATYGVSSSPSSRPGGGEEEDEIPPEFSDTAGLKAEGEEDFEGDVDGDGVEGMEDGEVEFEEDLAGDIGVEREAEDDLVEGLEGETYEEDLAGDTGVEGEAEDDLVEGLEGETHEGEDIVSEEGMFEGEDVADNGVEGEMFEGEELASKMDGEGETLEDDTAGDIGMEGETFEEQEEENIGVEGEEFEGEIDEMVKELEGEILEGEGFEEGDVEMVGTLGDEDVSQEPEFDHEDIQPEFIGDEYSVEVGEKTDDGDSIQEDIAQLGASTDNFGNETEVASGQLVKSCEQAQTTKTDVTDENDTPVNITGNTGQKEVENTDGEKAVDAAEADSVQEKSANITDDGEDKNNQPDSGDDKETSGSQKDEKEKARVFREALKPGEIRKHKRGLVYLLPDEEFRNESKVFTFPSSSQASVAVPQYFFGPDFNSEFFRHHIRVTGFSFEDMVHTDLREVTRLASSFKWSMNQKEPGTRILHLMVEMGFPNLKSKLDRPTKLMEELLVARLSNNVVQFEITCSYRSTSGCRYHEQKMHRVHVTHEKAAFKVNSPYVRKMITDHGRTRREGQSRVQKRSLFLNNLPPTISKNLIRLVYPHAEDINIVHVNDQTRSAVVVMRSSSHAYSSMIGFTDIVFDGQVVQVSMEDKSQEDALKEYEQGHKARASSRQHEKHDKEEVQKAESKENQKTEPGTEPEAKGAEKGASGEREKTGEGEKEKAEQVVTETPEEKEKREQEEKERREKEEKERRERREREEKERRERKERREKEERERREKERAERERREKERKEREKKEREEREKRRKEREERERKERERREKERAEREKREQERREKERVRREKERKEREEREKKERERREKEEQEREERRRKEREKRRLEEEEEERERKRKRDEEYQDKKKALDRMEREWASKLEKNVGRHWKAKKSEEEEREEALERMEREWERSQDSRHYSPRGRSRERRSRNRSSRSRDSSLRERSRNRSREVRSREGDWSRHDRRSRDQRSASGSGARRLGHQHDVVGARHFEQSPGFLQKLQILTASSKTTSVIDQDLARKVAVQTQMLEQERQKELLGLQQSLMLQKQQQEQQQQQLLQQQKIQQQIRQQVTALGLGVNSAAGSAIVEAAMMKVKQQQMLEKQHELEKEKQLEVTKEKLQQEVQRQAEELQKHLTLLQSLNSAPSSAATATLSQVQVLAKGLKQAQSALKGETEIPPRGHVSSDRGLGAGTDYDKYPVARGRASETVTRQGRKSPPPSRRDTNYQSVLEEYEKEFSILRKSAMSTDSNPPSRNLPEQRAGPYSRSGDLQSFEKPDYQRGRGTGSSYSDKERYSPQFSPRFDDYERGRSREPHHEVLDTPVSSSGGTQQRIFRDYSHKERYREPEEDTRRPVGIGGRGTEFGDYRDRPSIRGEDQNLTSSFTDRRHQDDEERFERGRLDDQDRPFNPRASTTGGHSGGKWVDDVTERRQAASDRLQSAQQRLLDSIQGSRTGASGSVGLRDRPGANQPPSTPAGRDVRSLTSTDYGTSQYGSDTRKAPLTSQFGGLGNDEFRRGRDGEHGREVTEYGHESGGQYDREGAQHFGRGVGTQSIGRGGNFGRAEATQSGSKGASQFGREADTQFDKAGSEFGRGRGVGSQFIRGRGRGDTQFGSRADREADPTQVGGKPGGQFGRGRGADSQFGGKAAGRGRGQYGTGTAGNQYGRGGDTQFGSEGGRQYGTEGDQYGSGTTQYGGRTGSQYGSSTGTPYGGGKAGNQFGGATGNQYGSKAGNQWGTEATQYGTGATQYGSGSTEYGSGYSSGATQYDYGHTAGSQYGGANTDPVQYSMGRGQQTFNNPATGGQFGAGGTGTGSAGRGAGGVGRAGHKPASGPSFAAKRQQQGPFGLHQLTSRCGGRMPRPHFATYLTGPNVRPKFWSQFGNNKFGGSGPGSSQY